MLALAAAPAAAAATGRQLYRTFCGDCHALAAARAAGFGTTKGLGPNGGPSLDELRVPYALTITAVEQPTGGHEVVKRKMTWKQVRTVAAWLAAVTKHHPLPALPTDG